MPDKFQERSEDELQALFSRYKQKYDLEMLLIDLRRKKKELHDERFQLECRWEEELNAYNNRVNANKDRTQVTKHKEVIPLISDAVEENHAQVFRAIFPPHENFFQVKVGDDRLQPAADIVSKYIHSDMRRHNMDELSQAFKLQTLHGGALVKSFWEQKFRKSLALNQETGKLEARDILERDGVKVKSISNFDWLFDTDLPFGEGLFFEFFSEDEAIFERKIKDGLYFDAGDLDPRKTSFNQDSDVDRQTDIDEAKDQAELTPQIEQAMPIGMFDIIVVWGNIPVLNKETQKYEVLENHRVIIANEDKVISIDPNPNADGSLNHMPIFGVMSPDPRNPYPVSLIGNALGFFHSANLFFNVLLDLVEFQIKMPREYNPKDTVLAQWLASHEGGVINMAGEFIPTSFGTRPMDFSPTINNFGFAAIGELINRFNESTKSIKNFTQPNFQKTATEIQGILEQITAFQANVVNTIQRTFVVPFIRKYWNMVLQYKVVISPSEMIKEMSTVLNMNVEEHLKQHNLPPEALFAVDWDFVATANNFAILKRRNAEVLRQALEAVISDPEAEKFMKKEKIYETLWREMDLPNMEDIMRTPAEQRAFAQEQAQSQEQAQQREKERLVFEGLAKKQPGLLKEILDQEQQLKAQQAQAAQGGQNVQ